MEQKKWQSPVVWASFAALVVAFMREVLGLNFDSDMANQMIGALITLLVGFGILNNPNSRETF
jgi:uncharacterized membrane protein